MSTHQYPQILRLENRLAALDRINPWLEKAWVDCGLPAELCFEIALCIYEAVANIIMYAYQEPDGYSKPPEQVQRIIEIALSQRSDVIEVNIQDDGYHFDPLGTPEKKVAHTISGAPLSGRGIPLIRGLSDKLSYQRSGGYNRLTIIRNLEPRTS